MNGTKPQLDISKARLTEFTEDFSAGRYHHEIYLSDARKCAPERLRTVIRHPIKHI